MPSKASHATRFARCMIQFLAKAELHGQRTWAATAQYTYVLTQSPHMDAIGRICYGHDSQARQCANPRSLAKLQESLPRNPYSTMVALLVYGIDQALHVLESLAAGQGRVEQAPGIGLAVAQTDQ